MKILYSYLLKTCVFSALLLGIASSEAWAQIPQQLNYQGALRDNGGKAIPNEQISIRLSIQESGANGMVHYSEERKVITNALGLYTVRIGDPNGVQKATGDFAQIAWGTGSKSLKVEVDIDGGTNYQLAGITPLVSVPYALYAKFAENGPAGPAGADGSTILSGTTDPQPGIGKPGDYYFNTTTYTLYGPQNPDGTWPQGTVLLQGPAGPVGPPGANGLSAYEVWESLPANDGKTITQFLDGLKGADGAQGPIGPAGADGLSAYEVWESLPANDGKTITEFLDGLKGADGAQGPIGPAGADGLSAYEVWESLPANDGKTITQFLDGLKGADGADGLSIISATISPSSGNLILTLSDNTTIVAGKVIGPQGPAGPAGDTGVGISETKVFAGNLMLTLTDGSVLNAGPVVGPAGTSVVSATINEIGHLILTFSNGSTSDAGFAIGSTGPPGAPGTNGINCWDLNGNGVNDPSEDINADNQFNTQDCLASGTGTTNLTNGHIFVGNSTNIATDVAMSGDATISNTGALTIANDAVTTDKMGTAGATDANKIYITDNNGDPQLVNQNLFAWTVNGNTGTNANHFIGTTDQQNLRFRVNNKPAGNLGYFDIITSFGTDAGSKIQSGNVNLFLGFSAGKEIVTANNTTIIGSSAGRNMNTSIDNTFIGSQAGINASFAERNTYIGANSGQNNIGIDNLFLGYNSGQNASSTVSNSVFIGSNSSSSVPAGTNLTNAIAIGYQSKVNANNSLVLGGTLGNAVNVGINTTAPEARLHVNDGHLFFPQTTKPTISISNFNGITGANIADNSSDTRGRINISGTTSTFGGAFSVVAVVDYLPKGANAFSVITITPGNTAAAACEYLVTPTATGFFLHFRGRTAVVTNPVFYYMAMD